MNITSLPFHEQLRWFKYELGIDREEMSAILGIASRTLDAWTSGESRPPLKITEEGALARLQAIIERTKPCSYLGR